MRSKVPPTVIDAEESDSPLWRERLTALQAWYDAEYARVHRSTEEPGLWISMRDQCVEGRLPWLEMYACRRGAEAVLRRGRTGRTEGIRLLRAGYDLALRLAADGTRADLEELGRLAHVDLRPSEATVWADEPHLQGLTPRERELLGYLVQGLTYAEIAATLVISEKTVSSHVSNLLRKTGTSSRIELARLVTRLQSVPG
jgi:DNA-binding CsgD family transcriptional regulator